MVAIDQGLSIPEDELQFVYSRSSGPGGQHVNKSSTRVTLRFDVDRSPSLTAEQRARLRTRLATRISAAGILQVSSQRSRSRRSNEEAALLRFVELVRAALHREPPRTATKATRASRDKRITEKKARGALKKGRRGSAFED
jgi:ribosome-associated protein